MIKSESRRRNLYRRKIFFVILTVMMLSTITVCLSACSGGSDETNNSANAGTESDNSFSSVYYYEKDNEQRYKSYAEANPGMNIEDVVWRVNAKLDGEFYVDYVEYTNDDDMNDQFIIVNKYHKLPENYVPDNLVSIGSRAQLTGEAADAYKKMEAAAENEGIHYVSRTGFRSYSYQQSLYESYKAEDPEGAETYSARPGFSEHQTGLAVDIGISDGGSLRAFNDTKQAEWVAANAYKYGFIIRYTEENKGETGYISEPWHIRYIGKEHAGQMHETGISSYEEYKVKYIDHTPK